MRLCGRRHCHAKTQCDTGYDKDDCGTVCSGVSGTVVSVVDDTPCRGGNGGHSGARRFIFSAGCYGCRRKCHALRQPVCVGGTGAHRRLSGTGAASRTLFLSDARCAGFHGGVLVCAGTQPAVFAGCGTGRCGTDDGTAAAAVGVLCVPAWVFQRRVPCGSAGALRCAGIFAACGDSGISSAPRSCKFRAGLSGFDLQYGSRNILHGDFSDSAVCPAQRIRRNMQPFLLALWQAGISGGAGRMPDRSAQHGERHPDPHHPPAVRR